MKNYSEEWEDEVRKKSDALIGAVVNLDSMLPSVFGEEGGKSLQNM